MVARRGARTSTRGTPFVRNYKDEEWREPSEGYNGPEPQKGLYPMTLVRVEPHQTEAGNDSIHWQFQATEDAVHANGDEYAGWIGHAYTNDEGAKFREQEIMVALGAIRPNGQYKGTLEALLKKYGNVVVLGRVIREKYIPEGETDGEWRAKLRTVIKSRDNVPGKKRPLDEDGDYDDDVEVDEDVEEEAPVAPPKRARRGKAAPEPEPEEVEEDEDAEEAGDDEEYDPDELFEDLSEMTLVALKKRAKEEFDFTTAELRGKTAEDIIAEIFEALELELPEDEAEEEVEEEPEPPKRSARTRTTTKAKPTRARAAKKGGDQDPPF